MKKLIFLLIIMMMLLSLLISCGEETSGEPDNRSELAGDNSAAAGNSETPHENMPDKHTDELGDFDFGRHEFSMLTRLNPRYVSPINAEEEIGDVLNDAIYVCSIRFPRCRILI